MELLFEKFAFLPLREKLLPDISSFSQTTQQMLVLLGKIQANKKRLQLFPKEDFLATFFR